MKITAVICTYNRFDYLAEALDSLRQQTLANSQYEIIVVDNSDDEQTAKKFWAGFELPSNARLIRTHPPGLSRARNAGLEAARAPILAFLDDDAIASPSWLEHYLRYFEDARLGVAGGAINPLWPGHKPQWLPPELLGCLSVVDFGENNRYLLDGQYAFGANMAFRVDALKSIGGFDTRIGRIGSNTLLSNEEIVIQDALVERGWQKGYCAQAAVDHHVEESRLSRNWFRSRMAWQAVSELMLDDGAFSIDWAQNQLTCYARILGAEDFVAKLLANTEREALENQLHFIRHLTSVLLYAKNLPDAQFELVQAKAEGVPEASGRSPIDFLPPSCQGGEGYKYSPTLPSQGKALLFCDFTPGHAYLYEAYGLSPEAEFLPLEDNLWEHPARRSLESVRRSIRTGTQALVFLTLDPLLYSAQAHFFRRFLEKIEIPVFGILHRIPGELELESYRSLTPLLKGIFVLSKPQVELVSDALNFNPVHYLPHHPSNFRHVPQSRLKPSEQQQADKAKITVGLLGELRKGKGLELLLDTLDHLASRAPRDFHFIIAGKASDYDTDYLQYRLEKSACSFELHAGQTNSSDNYVYLNSHCFTQLIGRVDIGLLLYQDSQRKLTSGLLADYIWQNKAVIATANSLTGSEVATHELGACLVDESPLGLAQALQELAPKLADIARSSRYRAYREHIAPEQVASVIRQHILD